MIVAIVTDGRASSAVIGRPSDVRLSLAVESAHVSSPDVTPDALRVPRALITGITGQDGSYLAELLISKGYEVHGLMRRVSTFPTERIDHLYQDPHEGEPRLRLHLADLTDAGALSRLLQEIRPAEVYNLGAQSHVRVSFDQPIYTAEATGVGTLKLLEAANRAAGRVGQRPVLRSDLQASAGSLDSHGQCLGTNSPSYQTDCTLIGLASTATTRIGASSDQLRR